MPLKNVRVSEKFVVGTAHTKVTFKICKLSKLTNINKGRLHKEEEKHQHQLRNVFQISLRATA